MVAASVPGGESILLNYLANSKNGNFTASGEGGNGY